MSDYRLCKHPDEDHQWQDEMRARQKKPTRSDYSSGGAGGSPVPTLERMLIALYKAEVDFAIHSAWDAGVSISVSKPRDGGSTHRLFNYGNAPHDFPTASSMWEAVVLFVCETVIRDWDNLDELAPVDSGCLECTLGTTPNRFNTGLCVYHIADHVLQTHGLRKLEPSHD